MQIYTCDHMLVRLGGFGQDGNAGLIVPSSDLLSEFDNAMPEF
jgi:hypothetical protein